MIKVNKSLILGSLALLTGAFAVSASQTLINNTGDSVFAKSGTNVIATNGSYSGTYYGISNGNNVAFAGSGNNLNVGLSSASTSIVAYRPFDADYTIKLGDLQIGESLSLNFNATINGVGSTAMFSFGFIDYTDNQAPIYAVDRPDGSSNSGFYYRANSTFMGTTGQLQGTKWSESVFQDGLSHDVNYTITAAGSGQYTLTLQVDDTILSSQLLTWNATQVNYNITGIAFRNEGTGITLSDINVLYTTIPEPSTFLLLGVGAGLLVFMRHRR
jgi:hypothetical protein